MCECRNRSNIIFSRNRTDVETMESTEGESDNIIVSRKAGISTKFLSHMDRNKTNNVDSAPIDQPISVKQNKTCLFQLHLLQKFLRKKTNFILFIS